MTFLDTTHYDETFTFDPHRNEVLGLVLSALLPLAAALVVSGLVVLFGMTEVAPLYADPAGNWWASVLLLPLFPMWGVAHWLAAREGAAGHAAARWVLAVIGWGLVYPFLAGMLDSFMLNWFNVFSLLLIGSTALRLASVSRPAMLLVLPSLLWVALAAIPGYVLLTNGWSPGFAVTVGAIGKHDGH